MARATSRVSPFRTRIGVPGMVGCDEYGDEIGVEEVKRGQKVWSR